jgi:hypothetical protein
MRGGYNTRQGKDLLMNKLILVLSTLALLAILASPRTVYACPA